MPFTSAHMQLEPGLDHTIFPIAFPPPEGTAEVPLWNGRGFSIGQVESAVLAYEVGSSGWTDGLTVFHEETAGEDHYIDRASRRHAAKSLHQWLRAGPVSPVIIDIGCSSGLMLKVLREEFPHASITGADYVRGPLEALAAKLPGIPLVQFDLTKCPLPDESVDGIVLLNVLEHIDRDDLALHHVARILKPNGVVIMEVPAGPSLYDVYDKLLLHHRRYRMSALLRKIDGCGLRVRERSHLGFFLYPGFWLAKRRGQRYLGQPEEVQRAIVSRNIRTASSHVLMHGLMALEGALRGWVYYPFGIRCLVTCQKAGPAAPGKLH
jgi:SAM-dependent methyltransferase